MKWRKLGKIFTPTDYQLPENCVEFAQSPQALVFDDFVRIYFSTREKDQTGKFLSHISFVEFDRKFGKVVNISTNTVIALGKPGCFDEHGIFPLNILLDKDRVLGYISGWSRRVSVSVETAIGLAISHDGGITFNRLGDGPILSASRNEPFLVGDPFVRVYDGAYHMWYIYGTSWIRQASTDAPDRVYKIGHATSLDGISWNRTGRQLVKDKLNSNECQALPTVIDFDDKYHMFFCYRQSLGFRKNRDHAYRIGYAFSNDLVNWTRDDDNVGLDVSPGEWDSDMLCYPHVFRCNGNIYMLYNGNEFGRFGFGLAVMER
jgi:predicted GH43/DUF377 family glycosyl hydrolase